MGRHRGGSGGKKKPVTAVKASKGWGKSGHQKLIARCVLCVCVCVCVCVRSSSVRV